MKSKLQIIKASYGGADCKEALFPRIKNDTLFFRADNNIIGDPAPNILKKLKIEYIFNDEIFKEFYEENSFVKIPKTKNKKLGIFCTNNNKNINIVINESLNYINISNINRKVDIITCGWEKNEKNPFFEIISWTKSYSHLNHLLQIMQCLYTARELGDYEYVSFLEHDVLYPENYFDYPEFQSNAIANKNYIGMTRKGFQNSNPMHLPFHQVTMKFQRAIEHCEKILPNALTTNSGCIEPSNLEVWFSEYPCVHINQNDPRFHFTNHYDTYQKETFNHDPYWGEYNKYLHLFV